MATLRLDTQTAPGAPSSGQAFGYVDSTTKRWRTQNDAAAVAVYPYEIANASAAGAAGAFATDTYLAGSSATIPTAGDWSVGQSYACVFDMTKTAAGTAQFTITVRMGTAGTVADAAIVTFAFGAGTAAADTGRFVVELTFQAVGSGTSAVLVGMATCSHHLAATGLVSTGASGTGIILASSAGFNSTTQTVLGLSVNGGASFSGTTTIAQARTWKV